MRNTIYKYPIDRSSARDSIVRVHGGCGGRFWPQVVHVGLDPAGTPCIWCEVDADVHPSPTIAATVLCVMSGEDLGRELPQYHLGSFVDGDFVVHVYSPHLNRVGQRRLDDGDTFGHSPVR